MRERALVHVAGPAGAGKTTLIERLLDAQVAFALCVRGERDPKVRQEQESSPKAHPELRRYRGAGACDVALYRFSEPSMDEFFMDKGYDGIERAQVVVVNVRSDAERHMAESLIEDVARLRKEEAIFRDVIGSRGPRLPITAVIANLWDPKDAGLKKAVARVKRATKRRST